MDKKQDIFDHQLFWRTGQDLLRKVNEAERLKPGEAEASWLEVEMRLKPRKRWFQHWYAVASSAAAALLLLCSVGLYFWAEKQEDSSLPLALLDTALGTLPKDEIVLIQKEEQMRLEDEASITYDAKGKLSVGERQEGSVPATGKEEVLNQMIVPKGKRVHITFSDGTKMYVNADTRVIYPAVFAQDKREILVDGEVFLDVRKDASRPFIVKTNQFDVKVLGTLFNICAYRDQPSSSVVLVEGAVEVKAGKNEKAVLAPNQLMEINDAGASVRAVDVFEYICWKDNLMWLDGRKAGEIFTRLSRYYGRTIVFDPVIGEIPLSGKLDLRERVEDVIQVVCQSLFLEYKTDEKDRILILK